MIDTFCICEVCREKVDPADPDVVRAIELIEVVGIGPTHEQHERVPVELHAAN